MSHRILTAALAATMLAAPATASAGSGDALVSLSKNALGTLGSKVLGWGVSQVLDELFGEESPVDLSEESLEAIADIVGEELDEQTLAILDAEARALFDDIADYDRERQDDGSYDDDEVDRIIINLRPIIEQFVDPEVIGEENLLLVGPTVSHLIASELVLMAEHEELMRLSVYNEPDWAELFEQAGERLEDIDAVQDVAHGWALDLFRGPQWRYDDGQLVVCWAYGTDYEHCEEVDGVAVGAETLITIDGVQMAMDFNDTTDEDFDRLYEVFPALETAILAKRGEVLGADWSEFRAHVENIALGEDGSFEYCGDNVCSSGEFDEGLCQEDCIEEGDLQYSTAQNFVELLAVAMSAHDTAEAELEALDCTGFSWWQFSARRSCSVKQATYTSQLIQNDILSQVYETFVRGLTSRS